MKMNQPNKKCLVLTTVNKPTEAVREFLKTGYDVIVVGDRKTPADYRSLDCVFLDIDAQRKQYPNISRLLPMDSYSRKNIGYLHAMRNGYEVIAESDDDNIPYDGWGRLEHAFTRTVVAPKYPNLYSLFTDEPIWPRGFPLEKIRAGEKIVIEDAPPAAPGENGRPFIIQSLVDGDPDVDAIHRLVFGAREEFRFGQGAYLLNRGVLSPFNTQNTFWVDRRAFPFLYLPATVSFRSCDILKSFVAQNGIWQRGGRLAFVAASARQQRNPHDLAADFRSELPIYLGFYKTMQALDSARLRGNDDDLRVMYRALYESGVVQEQELRIVDEWLDAASR